MGKTFAELQEMYREVVKRFNRIELQEWRAEGAMIELSKQVGELAKQVMIYRNRDNQVIELTEAGLKTGAGVLTIKNGEAPALCYAGGQNGQICYSSALHKVTAIDGSYSQ